MKDLAKRAAELFGPSTGHWDKGRLTCYKCGLRKDDQKYKDFCPIPDPIDITDLGKALECFRGIGMRTDELFGYIATVKYDRIYGSKTVSLADPTLEIIWLAKYATAEQIWEICVLAKESEK